MPHLFLLRRQYRSNTIHVEAENCHGQISLSDAANRYLHSVISQVIQVLTVDLPGQDRSHKFLWQRAGIIHILVSKWH
jgi:hypothetical protein